MNDANPQFIMKGNKLDKNSKNNKFGDHLDIDEDEEEEEQDSKNSVDGRNLKPSNKNIGMYGGKTLN